MSPASVPVLAGAALVSSPAFHAWATGAGTADAALTRYLVCVALVWSALSALAALVGPPPKAAVVGDGADGPQAAAPGTAEADPAPAGAGDRVR